jgi:hypothetical protein
VDKIFHSTARKKKKEKKRKKRRKKVMGNSALIARLVEPNREITHADVEKVWQHYDTDHNNNLSQSEARKFLVDLYKATHDQHSPPKGWAEGMFVECDVDTSGSLGFDQFQTLFVASCLYLGEKPLAKPGIHLDQALKDDVLGDALKNSVAGSNDDSDEKKKKKKKSHHRHSHHSHHHHKKHKIPQAKKGGARITAESTGCACTRGEGCDRQHEVSVPSSELLMAPPAGLDDGLDDGEQATETRKGATRVTASSSGCACLQGNPCDRSHEVETMLKPAFLIRHDDGGGDKDGNDDDDEQDAAPIKHTKTAHAKKKKGPSTRQGAESVTAESSGCPCVRGEPCDRAHEAPPAFLMEH